MINSRSLAEELAEADPFYRVRLTGSPSPMSPANTSQPCVSYQPGQQGELAVLAFLQWIAKWSLQEDINLLKTSVLI